MSVDLSRVNFGDLGNLYNVGITSISGASGTTQVATGSYVHVGHDPGYHYEPGKPIITIPTSQPAATSILQPGFGSFLVGLLIVLPTAVAILAFWLAVTRLAQARRRYLTPADLL